MLTGADLRVQESVVSEQQQHNPEVDAVLGKLDATLKQADLHPILKPVLMSMQNEDGVWWPEGMPLERVTEIKAMLDDAVTDKSIIKAVYDLLQGAAAVGAAPGGEMVGAHLVRICNDVIHEKKLMSMLGADAEFAPGTVEKAKDVVGGAARATPAMVGDKPPEGALRIDQLAGNKRRM